MGVRKGGGRLASEYRRGLMHQPFMSCGFNHDGCIVHATCGIAAEKGSAHPATPRGSDWPSPTSSWLARMTILRVPAAKMGRHPSPVAHVRRTGLPGLRCRKLPGGNLVPFWRLRRL